MFRITSADRFLSHPQASEPDPAGAQLLEAQLGVRPGPLGPGHDHSIGPKAGSGPTAATAAAAAVNDHAASGDLHV